MNFRKVTIQTGSKIQFMSPELLFLGESGQPYRGTLYVDFISQGESMDMRDFKSYMTSLRSVMMCAEDVAYTIYTKIAENVEVEALGVTVDLTARGGIQQRISYGDTFEVVQKRNIFQVG